MTNDIGYALVAMKHGANCSTTMHPHRVHHFGRAVLRGVILKNIFSVIFMFPCQDVLENVSIVQRKKLVGNGLKHDGMIQAGSMVTSL